MAPGPRSSKHPECFKDISKHRSSVVQSFTYAHGLHALKQLQEEATGVRLACINHNSMSTGNQPPNCGSGEQLLSTWPLSVGFVQTAALREVVYSFVKRVPLVYPLHSIYRDKLVPLAALHHHARGTTCTDACKIHIHVFTRSQGHLADVH